MNRKSHDFVNVCCINTNILIKYISAVKLSTYIQRYLMQTCVIYCRLAKQGHRSVSEELMCLHPKRLTTWEPKVSAQLTSSKQYQNDQNSPFFQSTPVMFIQFMAFYLSFTIT